MLSIAPRPRAHHGVGGRAVCVLDECLKTPPLKVASSFYFESMTKLCQGVFAMTLH